MLPSSVLCCLRPREYLMREKHMTWETPEVEDLGTIADNTFITPGGDNKGQPGHDPFSEISVHS